MSEPQLTAQEWADMNAAALAEKNREILGECLTRLEEINKSMQVVDKDREATHWRRVFAAAAIESGKTCDAAIEVAEEMVQRLCSA